MQQSRSELINSPVDIRAQSHSHMTQIKADIYSVYNRRGGADTESQVHEYLLQWLCKMLICALVTLSLLSLVA